MPQRALKSNVRLEGPVQVAWRRGKGEWHCRVLEFDILGTGKTKEEAFDEAKSLFEEYVLWAARELLQGNDIAFHNPSEAEEWDKASSRKSYYVQFTVEVLETPNRSSVNGMKSLIKFINSLNGTFEGADLVAV